MFFDWKIQLEKIQLTRHLTDNISSSKNTRSNDKISWKIFY